MVKITPKKGLAWKPLSLKSKVLSHSLDLDGLIGVEELSDYSLDKKNNTVVIGAPKEVKPTLKTIDGGVKKKRKRNRTKKGNHKSKPEETEDDQHEKDEEDAEENDNMDESNVVPADSPTKKKLKRKKNNKFLVEESNDNNTQDEDDLESEQTDTSEPHCKKLKQKKKNKKQTYLSIKSEHIPCITANNEEFFVEMSEWLKLNIPETVVKALYEKGFKTPTKIQSLVLPSALLARKDIVGAAETGSGKTLAFGIPILTGIINKIENPIEDEDNDSGLEEEEVENIDNEESANTIEFVKRKRNKLYALVLTPTRELAIQVQNHILDAAKYTPVKVACVVGGLSTEKQIRILNQSPHILVATPGRLWEFIQLGHFHLTELYKLNYLVIDETDRMIESGHFPELKNILDRVTMTETSQPRQTFVFSATLTHSLKNSLNLKKGQTKSKKLPKGDPSIRKLQDLLKIKSPKIVDITEKMGLTKTLTESKIFCKHDEKDSYLYYFVLQHPGRTLVFCNSISSVKRMTQLLTMLKCAPLPLHASMNQRQRLKNLDKFRAQNNSILLATDVAARGLDIPGIEHVIHYHVPRTSEIYIHRSGRTARANKEGLTLVLVEKDEISLYIKMFNSLEKKIDLPDFPTDESFLSLANKRIELAKSIDHLENKLKKNRPDNWLEKAAKDMDIIVDDENLIQSKESSREEKLITKALSAKRKELQSLLSKNIQSSQCQVSTQSALNAVKQCVEDVKEEKKMALKKRNKHKRKFKRKKKTSAAPTT